MLEFREINYSKDIEEIVDLLLISLSDANSKEHFIWKHVKNPFGKSYGLLACDEGKIVGVRMFMFWQFRRNSKVITAIRPVDTITHPDYRGKGIFKKLTLEGLNNCRGRYKLVFNTPNENSFPGYLKMGWEKYTDQLQYKLGVVLPSFNKDLYIEKRKIDNINTTDFNSFLFWRTNFSDEFVKWRYAAPIYEKVFYSYKNYEGYVIYRLRKIKGIKVLILIDYIGEKSCLNRVIKRLAAKNKTVFIHYLDNRMMSSLKPLQSFKRHESIVVYRDDKLNISSGVLFSSGDLEGRL